jgi:phage virion morphogenesis protein
MDALEPWLADIAARLTPGRRRALAGKIGRVMRGENAKRVQANVEPDGTVMAARNPKPRPNAKKKRGRKATGGRMFKRIELAKNMQVQTSQDGARLSFKGVSPGQPRCITSALKTRSTIAFATRSASATKRAASLGLAQVIATP